MKEKEQIHYTRGGKMVYTTISVEIILVKGTSELMSETEGKECKWCRGEMKARDEKSNQE